MRALFLDRDGVINIENEGNYILKLSEFIFDKGAKEAIQKLSKHFDKIIVVTNQRCIGRGLLKEEELQIIHDYMVNAIEKSGGKIDKIYFAPAVDTDDVMRKPNVGMGALAKKDFPDIIFEESVMVGNNLSDMKFGKRLGMKTIFVATTKPFQEMPNDLIDEQYENLSAFANQFKD